MAVRPAPALRNSTPAGDRLPTVPDDPGQAGSAPATPPTPPEDDGLADKIRKILPALLDEILGTDDDKSKTDAPPPPSAPKTDRQVEQSLRDQVASTVKDLERERAHDQEHEALRPKPPAPPSEEVKPWRHRLWGE